MNKAVLLSIHPKWCKLIANEKKTLEVRKRKPKIKTPFKAYIYCTKSSSDILWILNAKERSNCEKIADLIKAKDAGGAFKGNGKIIGEFICDYILGHCESSNADITEQKGHIKREQLFEYAQRKELYGWHISGLKIYDKPKDLSELYNICSEWKKEKITNKCHKCAHLFKNDNEMCYLCSIEGEKQIKRPPQSWCYVEEL